MTKHEANLLLDAARAGVPISAAEINAALVLTGDLGPYKRPAQVVAELTRAVPRFSPGRTPSPPRPAPYALRLPALVHKPFALERK